MCRCCVLSKVLCGVLSGGGKCCSPVMCACVCAALFSPPLSGPSPAAQPLRVHWTHCGNQLKEDSTAELATSEADKDIRCRRYKD